jgi:hypothetical protein
MQFRIYLARPFNRANLIHSHDTRGHRYNFVIPKPNTNFLKNSLEYNGVVVWSVWNSIPIEILDYRNFRIEILDFT